MLTVYTYEQVISKSRQVPTSQMQSLLDTIVVEFADTAKSTGLNIKVSGLAK
jgi:hypothetical protein